MESHGLTAAESAASASSEGWAVRFRDQAVTFLQLRRVNRNGVQPGDARSSWIDDDHELIRNGVCNREFAEKCAGSFRNFSAKRYQVIRLFIG